MVKMEYKRKRSKKIKNGEANFLENNAVSYSKRARLSGTGARTENWIRNRN